MPSLSPFFVSKNHLNNSCSSLAFKVALMMKVSTPEFIPVDNNDFLDKVFHFLDLRGQ